MARIIFEIEGDRSEITVEQLVTIIRGVSIEGAYLDQNKGRDTSEPIGESIDIKTTGGHVLRIASTEPISVEVRDYSNAEDTRLQVVSGYNILARDAENSIRAIRQLYAMTLLLYTDRIDHIASGFERSLDLEDLLNEEERLRLSSTGFGSFWITVANWSSAGRSAVVAVAGMFFSDGRQALLRHLRARARSAELDVEKKEFELEYDKIIKLLELYQRLNKIKDPVLKNEVISAFEENLTKVNASVGLKIVGLAKENRDD